MISVCMIVKDNEATLFKCLESIKDIADEIIVVDTGSKDKTKEIAKKFGSKICDFVWTYNFSEAKNYAISKAKHPWILEIDADESISKKDHQKIKNLIKSDEHLGYNFIQRNYTNEIGSFGWTSCKGDDYEESKVATGFVARNMVRLYKNDKRIKKEGVIHDSVIKSIEKIGTIGDTDVVVHHFGLLNRNEDRLRWYIEMEKKNLRDDFFQEYQIGSQLFHLGELNEALEHFMKSLKLNQNFNLTWLEIAIISIKKGKIRESKPLLLKSLQLKEHEMAWNHLGIVESYEGNYKKAIECFEKAIQMNEKNADFHFNFSQTLKKAGDKRRAKQEYDRAVYLNPYYEKKGF